MLDETHDDFFFSIAELCCSVHCGSNVGIKFDVPLLHRVVITILICDGTVLC